MVTVGIRAHPGDRSIPRNLRAEMMTVASGMAYHGDPSP
jgi:hypothetical protein